MTPEQTERDKAADYARSAPSPAVAVSAYREKRCAACPRPIPVGERHIYDGDKTRHHAECYAKENR